MKSYFIEPLDILFFRGNRLHGESGSFGDLLMPPWPTTIAGAIRTAILHRDQVPLADFSAGQIEHPEVGTCYRSGSLRILSFHLARQTEKGIERFFPLPADLILSGEAENKQAHLLTPLQVDDGLSSSYPLSKLPLLHSKERSKPLGGYWLKEKGYRQYLEGQVPDMDQFEPTHHLWSIDHRIGIRIHADKRSAESGDLFSSDVLVLKPNIGFSLEIEGADLKRIDWIRFGGDGRSAHIKPIASLPRLSVKTQQIVAQKKARLILTSPGIFEQGWRLPGMDEQGHWRWQGIEAEVVAVAAARSEWVSGWDLAKQRPKTAYRAVGTGTVYWLENIQASSQQLQQLQQRGLWSHQDEASLKRLEGFNQFQFAL